MRNEEPLLQVEVDHATVGDMWPIALVQLIEEHERRRGDLARRKDVHRLLDRYVEAYFPEVIVGYEHRHRIIHLLSERYFYRHRRVSQVWASNLAREVLSGKFSHTGP